ncbi:hypothetical protein CCP4SC76_7010005 [Gammaproteobacteria bacterium]
MPALKVGIFDALISILAPVLGFRPMRAALSFTRNVPKPTRDTCFPSLRASTTASTKPSRTRPAVAFGMSPAFAMASTNPDLFIFYDPPSETKIIGQPSTGLTSSKTSQTALLGHLIRGFFGLSTKDFFNIQSTILKMGITLQLLRQ